MVSGWRGARRRRLCWKILWMRAEGSGGWAPGEWVTGRELGPQTLCAGETLAAFGVLALGGAVTQQLASGG